MELLLCWVESRNNDRRSARNLLFCLRRSKTKKDAAVSSGGAILLQMRRFWRGVSHGKCHGYFCVVSVLRCFLLAIKISPCTRGKLTAASDSTGGHWFTPVYTGQTLPPQNEWLFHRCIPVHTGQIFHPKIQALCSEIHPRTHGADPHSRSTGYKFQDSSPYARGRY